MSYWAENMLHDFRDRFHFRTSLSLWSQIVVVTLELIQAYKDIIKEVFWTLRNQEQNNQVCCCH